MLAYLASHEISGDYTLEKLLSDLNKYGIYTDKEAEECRASEYKSLLSIIQRNYFVISNLNNERLVRQSGSFLISGNIMFSLKEKSGRALLNGHIVMSKMNLNFKVLEYQREEKVQF